jgi:hypothetical protein
MNTQLVGDLKAEEAVLVMLLQPRAWAKGSQG